MVESRWFGVKVAVPGIVLLSVDVELSNVSDAASNVSDAACKDVHAICDVVRKSLR